MPRYMSKRVSFKTVEQRLARLQSREDGFYFIGGEWAPPAPRRARDRVPGTRYIVQGEYVRIWQLSPRSRRARWVCIHGKLAYVCPLCGGASLCPHNKLKSGCSICKDPKFFCKHGTRKIDCRKCGGTRICDHNKQRNFCAICSPHNVCFHGIIKWNCSRCRRMGYSPPFKTTNRKIRINITRIG